MKTSNLAIFASGSGTNAENIARYFGPDRFIHVVLILSNKPDAYVLTRAESLGIPTVVFNRNDFCESGMVRHALHDHHIDWIVLAGFLWLVPEYLIADYPGRIVNIHPALLPGYGGKGMYGSRVHEAVITNREKESGITIHYVNHEYDSGNIIFQARCPVESCDTPETLARKVHRLEYLHYPKVLEELIRNAEKGK